MSKTRTIVEESPQNVAVMDVFSRLIQERIIFIDDIIDDELANNVIAQMMYLSSINKDEEIKIYINSPGGSVVAGLAIYDIAKLLGTPIKTVCIGMAASMACILMLMGKTRCGLKHSRFMLHDISGIAHGKYSDIKSSFEEIEVERKFIYDILKEKTSVPNVEDYLNVDRWIGSDKALEYNILTDILK